MAAIKEESPTTGGAGSLSRGTVPYVRRRVPIQILRGFCMGAADIIPGVSGGTVALLLGIYDQLIQQISSVSQAVGTLFRGDAKGFKQRFRSVDWLFLMSLLVGIVLAIGLLVSWLRTQIHDHPMIVSSAFFGVVAASAFVTRTEIQDWRSSRLVVFGTTLGLTFGWLGIRSGAYENPNPVVLIVAGAVAICAKILPGISGSFILLMVGLYDHLIEALDERNINVLALYVVGAIFGLALFSRVLHKLLSRYRDLIVSALLGLMVGSLRVLWPWPSNQGRLEDTRLGSPIAGDVIGASVAALLGAFAVVVLTGLVGRYQHFDGKDTLEMPR